MTPQQTINPSLQDNELQVGRLLNTLLEGKWIIIVITLISTLIGLSYVLLAAPQYKASALLQVEEKSSGMAVLGEVGDTLFQVANANAEIAILTSRKVLGSAVQDVKRDIIVKPRYFPLIGYFIANRYEGEQPARTEVFDSYAWGGEQINVSQLNVPHELLNKKLTLRATEQGYILLNNEGEELLNGRVGHVAEQSGISILVTDLIARPNTQFILTRASQLSAVSNLKRDLVVDEKGKSGVLELSLTGTNPVEVANTLDAVSRQYLLQNIQRQSAEAENSLQFLVEQQPDLKAKLERAEERLNRYRQQNKSVDLAIETQGVLTQLVELEKQLNELSFVESELSRLYTRAHPSYQALLEKKQALLNDKNELSSKVEHLPNTQQEVLRLTRDVEVSQEIYIQLLNKVQELNIVRAGNVGYVRVIDEAVTHPDAVKPQKMLMVSLATFLGALLGGGLVLLRNYLNQGIKNPEVFEQAGINVYASVPLSKAQQAHSLKLKKRHSKGSPQGTLLAQDDPTDLSIESLRSLRTSLHFAMMEATNNIVAIGGPSMGIGKSFISSNLAAICAQAGQKVLVIDADMRRGYLHTMFNTPAEQGLTEVLRDKLPLAQVVHSTAINNLYFMARGQVPPNPSELLMHHSFDALLELVSQQYDLVIIDTPPILAVTDPAIISAQAGTTLMVSRFAKNSLKEIETAIRRYQQNGIVVKGVVFNAVERSAAIYEYSNYEYYSYKSEA